MLVEREPLVIEREPMLTLLEAARLVPSYGQNKHVSTQSLRNWIYRGLRCPDGRIVFLKARKFGRNFMVTREAVERFVEESQPTYPAA